ncbi:substrate-binding domain-containing protein [Ramlibacter terrae]|uniref:Substrate-binding domain-containing protein n=1 Tax=Ramlibacter terrae TaxID=2732511 RepID=A0ABX6P569_9BURK|nr:substrate-binding domain-containing protein [Ramlibacter terrae]
MTAMLRGISSMATRQLLNELAADWLLRGGGTASVESVGGVDAAKRVAAGEPFDFVVLASDAIDKLVAGGHAVEGSRVDLVVSGVAIAVREGAPRPAIATEQALRETVLAAASIGYSTGPSGTALLQLFERWGITAQVRDKLVQARPGIPVGSLVASGEVALGFQQLSELVHLKGITVLGGMPEGATLDTIFSGAVCTASKQAEAARAVLAFMASDATREAKHRNGMQAA